MNYCILNGVKSNTIKGLLIQSLPFISKPKMRTQIEEIDGRDGDIVTKLGYSSYSKEMKIGLYGKYNIDDVIQYFDSQGTVTFSNEPDKIYYYEIIEQINFERLIRFKQATVIFHVQPFKYSAVEQPISISPNLLFVPDYQSQSNGLTATVANSVISIKGTTTKTTEFYIPVTISALASGYYSLNASSWGTNSNTTSIRLIKSVPTDADSFGNKYIALQNNAVVTLHGNVADNATFGYLWLYITAGTMDFSISASMVNNTNYSCTIKNDGNVVSRPTITLYGNGDATLSINGLQIFAINFMDSITIDGAEMNAYQGDKLMNRSVTGDYDNMILQPGNNTISWSGDITFVSIDNYSRWL